jgi:PAS domain S-box-containing protein
VAALTLERARLVRQRAEREAALRSEERFREIAETANEGVWMLDPALLTCFVNHRLARMLGYAPEEMLGKPVTAFVFEADAQGKLAQLERRKHGMSEQLETRYRRKDGSEVWAEVSATGSFDPAGRFTGVLAMISDITEQKRREAEGRVSRQEILLLTRVVEQTADSVLVTDRDGVIEYVNPAFETTTGYTKEEAIGRRPSILKSGRHDQDFYRTLWNELLEGRTFCGTLVNRKKNGGLYWAQQTITPIRDDEGAITHFVSVLKDVTELRRRHEQEVQLRLAHEVQRRFYQDPAPVPGFDLAAVSCPATETGGDYFDFIPAADGSFYLAVGDASGHGLGAALVMALTRAYVRSLVALDLGVGDVLTRVNRMLVADLEANRFVTLLLARIDGGGALHYANAGHVPGIVLGADGGEQAHATMPSTGTPLGLFAEAAFSEGQVSLQRDETLVLVTDGVTESAGQDGDQFGMDRLVECVQSHGHQPARTIAEGICQAALHFAGEEAQADDLTAVVARRC